MEVQLGVGLGESRDQLWAYKRASWLPVILSLQLAEKMQGIFRALSLKRN